MSFIQVVRELEGILEVKTTTGEWKADAYIMFAAKRTASTAISAANACLLLSPTVFDYSNPPDKLRLVEGNLVEGKLQPIG